MNDPENMHKVKLAEGTRKEYSGPSGGYGSLASVTEILARERVPVKCLSGIIPLFGIVSGP